MFNILNYIINGQNVPERKGRWYDSKTNDSSDFSLGFWITSLIYTKTLDVANCGVQNRATETYESWSGSTPSTGLAYQHGHLQCQSVATAYGKRCCCWGSHLPIHIVSTRDGRPLFPTRLRHMVQTAIRSQFTDRRKTGISYTINRPHTAYRPQASHFQHIQ